MIANNGLFCEALAAIVTFEQLRSWAAYEVNPSWRVMHQSIPAAPSPPGLLRGICLPCQSRGWGICKFCTSQAPGICQPLAFDHTQFPIRILLHRGFYLKNKQIGSFVKDGKKLKRFVKAWSRFYACISSLLIKPELQSETRELST